MNNERAREFFSAYYEGSLEHGLRQSLEQKLRSDRNLAADYAAFSETMSELDSLQSEDIELPMYLSDRVATRLEQNTTTAGAVHGAWRWLRALGMAGAAAAAAVAIVMVANNNTPGAAPTAIGGVAAPDVNSDQLNFNYIDGNITLNYKASRNKTILVSSAASGEEIKRFNLKGQQLVTTIDNPLEGTALLKVQVEGSENVAYLALPGNARSNATTGSGAVTDLAVALAGFYRVPVVVQTPDIGTAVNWDFKTADPRSAASAALSGFSHSVDLRPNGMVVIL